jgi:hypothetical protein
MDESEELRATAIDARQLARSTIDRRACAAFQFLAGKLDQKANGLESQQSYRSKQDRSLRIDYVSEFLVEKVSALLDVARGVVDTVSRAALLAMADDLIRMADRMGKIVQTRTRAAETVDVETPLPTKERH